MATKIKLLTTLAALLIKKFAEAVCHIENFCNFVNG